MCYQKFSGEDSETRIPPISNQQLSELHARIAFLEGALKGVQLQIRDKGLKQRIQDILDDAKTKCA